MSDAANETASVFGAETEALAVIAQVRATFSVFVAVMVAEDESGAVSAADSTFVAVTVAVGAAAAVSWRVVPAAMTAIPVKKATTPPV